MKSLVVAMIALAVLAPPALGQGTPPTKSTTQNPRTETGNQGQEMPHGQLRVTGQVHVGDGAPDFTAPSSSGREVTLSRLKGDWIVLVFAENREDFAALRRTQVELAGIGARILGLCKEKAHRLRSYVDSEGLPFDLLADDTGEISALYGYYNLERRSSTHGFVVVDRQGVVRLALQGQAPPQQVEELVRFTIVGF
jgi:peroxiredoxin Q/BCP